MNQTITAWLVLCLCLAVPATFAAWTGTARHKTSALVAFLIACIVSFAAIQVPLGAPMVGMPPAGTYVVLGARIDVDKAIYALLDSGDGEPRYYRLPYSTSNANDLQAALIEGQEGGRQTQVGVGEGGEISFHEAPVQEDAPKQAEVPMIGGI